MSITETDDVVPDLQREAGDLLDFMLFGPSWTINQQREEVLIALERMWSICAVLEKYPRPPETMHRRSTSRRNAMKAFVQQMGVIRDALQQLEEGQSKKYPTLRQLVQRLEGWFAATHQPTS